jgi:hypothetical protein
MAEAEAAGSDEFAERMMHMMNEAMLALMVSVGHRTGLFDVMAAMPAATSAEIASEAALDERYVREWLAAMTTGRIVDHDGAAGSFSLPADHTAWLTRAAGLGNLAIQAQYVGLLALVEDQIVDCFRRGGGVPYSAFPRIQAVMAEEAGGLSVRHWFPLDGNAACFLSVLQVDDGYIVIKPIADKSAEDSSCYEEIISRPCGSSKPGLNSSGP